jgi:hypothetical protein
MRSQLRTLRAVSIVVMAIGSVTACREPTAPSRETARVPRTIIRRRGVLPIFSDSAGRALLRPAALWRAAHGDTTWLKVVADPNMRSSATPQLGTASAGIGPISPKGPSFTSYVDGDTYYWDGASPSGDEDQAEILDHGATATAPNPVGQPPTAGGWMRFRGDRGENTIDYQADPRDGGIGIPPTTQSAEGEGEADCRSGETEPSNWLQQFLNLSPVCRIHRFTTVIDLTSGLGNTNCGISVTARASHRAWKGQPFGISVGAGVRGISASVDYQARPWGYQLAPPKMFTDRGWDCPTPWNPDANPHPAPGEPVDQTPWAETFEYTTYLPEPSNSVTCELMEAHYRYGDGSVSDSWYYWQCDNNTIIAA